MSYTQTLTESHTIPSRLPKTDTSLKATPFASPISNLTSLHSSNSNSSPSYPAITMNNAVRQQQSLYGIHGQPPLPQGFAPPTPGNLQQPPSFAPNGGPNIGSQFQRNQAQPPMGHMQNNNPLPPSNPAQVAPPMGALNPAPNLPIGGVPPVYGGGIGGQMQHQQPPGMGPNQASSLAQGSPQIMAQRRAALAQQLGGNPGPQGIASMGLGMPGMQQMGANMVRRTPSASQSAMSMGMGGMGLPGGGAGNAMGSLTSNNVVGVPMGGMGNMQMNPQMRRMAPGGPQPSPQPFPSQVPNPQGPPNNQIPGPQQSQPPGGGTPGINTSPSRPGSLANGAGIAGGMPREMNMGLAQQQHMLPNQSNQNPSMNQNSGQQMPGHQQHIGPHMPPSQQQHMNNMMQGPLGSVQNPSPMGSLNQQSQQNVNLPNHNLGQRPMSGLTLPMGGPMMNRGASAPGAGPSNPGVPPLGGPSLNHGAGSVMGGIGSSPVPHPQAPPPPMQSLQPSQHPSSQGMPQQQPFSNPLGIPQHSQSSQMPNHPSPSSMGAFQQQSPNPMNMGGMGGMGMGGMMGGMGGMSGMSGIGLGVGLPHPPNSASSQQSQSNQPQSGPGNGGAGAGMHPPAGTPHPHHASPPHRPGTSGGMTVSHPGTPMNIVGAGMRGSPRPQSRSASRVGGMQDGPAGQMNNGNPGVPGMGGLPGPSGAPNMMGMGAQGLPQGGPGHQGGPGQQLPFGGVRAPSGGAPFNFAGMPVNMGMGIPGAGGAAGGRQTPLQQGPMTGLPGSPGSVAGMGTGRGPTPVPVGAGGRQPAGFPTPADVLRQNAGGGMVGAPGTMGGPFGVVPGGVRPPSTQQPPPQQQAPHPFSSPLSHHNQPPHPRQPTPHQISPQSGIRTGSPALHGGMRPSTPASFGQPSQLPQQGPPIHPGAQMNRPPSRQVIPRGTPRLPQAPLPTTPGGGVPPSAMGMGSQMNPTGMRPQPPPNNVPTSADRPASRQQQNRQSTPQSQQASPTRTGSLPPSSAAPAGGPSQPQPPPNRVPPTPGAAPPGPSLDGQPAPISLPINGPAPGYFTSMPQKPYGQGIMRLMEFSEMLSNRANTNPTRRDWAGRTNEFFTNNGMLKITLWKDNQQQEAKPFDITTRIMPLFFEVTSSSGVVSMSISIDGARERTLMPQQYPVSSIWVDCPESVWTYRYRTGYIVTLKGPLTAHLFPVNPGGGGKGPLFKFESITFESKTHEKSLKLDSIIGVRSEATPASRHNTPRIKHEAVGGQQTITSEGEGSSASGSRNDDGQEQLIVIERATIPVEPVNAFGIPQATMRCLEQTQLAESVGQMGELYEFSRSNGFSPREALQAFAKKIHNDDPARLMHTSNHMLPMDMSGMNGVAPSPSVTLYQSSPALSTAAPHQAGGHPPQGHPQHLGTPGDTSSPLNTSTMASTPATMTPGQGGPSASSHSTPQLAHTNINLKRKQGPDGSSPATTHDQAPAKRQVKKHKRSVAGS